MVNTVTFANGNTYNDGITGTGHLGAGGHRTQLVPMLSDCVIAVAAAVTANGTAQTAATNAAASLASVTSIAAGVVLTTTSASSVTVGTGSKSFTLAAAINIATGQYLIVSDQSNAGNFVYGQITAWNPATKVVTIGSVAVIGGSGTISAWNASVAGAQGPTGPSGPGTGDMLKANNLSDVASASAALANIGGAPLANPVFTGTVQMPDQTAGDSSSKAANTRFVTSAVNSALPTGVFLPYGGGSLPSALFVWGNGTAISRTTYANLFSTYGTQFGNGDGSTTFNVPDARCCVIAGVDNMGSAGIRGLLSGAPISSSTLGAAGGTALFALSIPNLPAHNHFISSNGVAVALAQAFGGNGQAGYAGGQNVNSVTTTQNTGSGAGFSLVQPTLLLNFIIKT